MKGAQVQQDRLTKLAGCTGRSVWDGEALAEDERWVFSLSPGAASELVAIGRRLVRMALPLCSIGSAEAGLGALGEDLRQFATELRTGRGVVLVRKVPVDVERPVLDALFWALGTCFGVGVSQNRRGDYLGDVIDLSDQQTSGRPFQNGGELIMHRDPVDIVGLLCIRHAASGGLSRIASARQLHNIILSERPDLLERLYQGYVYHRLEEDRGDTPALTAQRVPVFAPAADGSVGCFFIPGPIRRGATPQAPIDGTGMEAFEFFTEVSKRPGVFSDMNLLPGDAQFLSNRTVLHSRTDYVDFPEIERRRHMLRLWLMAPDWPALHRDQRFFDESDRFGGGLPKAA
ncbi:TauD/TfdA family dioxygenase [Variovorax sp. PBL-E5]|uniref:TauD/TfdA family dioxygenase n=1 Tax=Variovorax sp. PBL-E5 TaxID=434014 RepID=UPI00131976BB|nr:TauD/TfdA family dioxygenase [Variovorax sp. PBL-E5]VTU23711.1 Taurine catabolism dioxygenase TauD, TfdA family [Variovorax sp. PBL-E5]